MEYLHFGEGGHTHVLQSLILALLEFKLILAGSNGFATIAFVETFRLLVVAICFFIFFLLAGVFDFLLILVDDQVGFFSLNCRCRRRRSR